MGNLTKMRKKPSQTKRATDRRNPPEELRVHMIKDPAFREIHADGAFGSVTPRGYIHFVLYAERAPIPREIVYEVDDDGFTEIPELRVSREGIIRELQVGAYLSIDAAEALSEWLRERVAEAKNLLKKR